jgi:transposase
MFLKSVFKTIKATGERKEYFRLCESYRCEGSVRHHTIIQLGALEELPDVEQRKTLARRIEQLIEEGRQGKMVLFASGGGIIEQLAVKFYAAIKQKERLDIAAGKDYHIVDVNSVKNKQVREAGAEWLCLQALGQLQIREFLRQKEWSEDQISLALTHITSRAAYPASELRTSQWIKDNSAVCELTGYDIQKISKDKLYGVSHSLYAVKDDLELHLSKRTNELFDLDDKIILYDLTNTYFEGQKRNSSLAQFGRSKEKRSDAKLVVLGVVVNTEGFLKYSNIYEGNTADATTLAGIIEQMGERTSTTGRRPVVVLDAGIATEANIELLRSKGYKYMCVSRSGLKKYKACTDSSPVQVQDNKGQSITLQKVAVDNSPDRYLHVHSNAKQQKEESMKVQFTQRFEQGLQQIKESIGKKGGAKGYAVVWERIGRLKEKYPSIHRHYDIEVVKDAKDIVTELKWQQKKVEAKEGMYLLRTNMNEQEEHTQWMIYNTIREIEYTFRTLKTDLDLRPIYHKNDEATKAHLHLGLLAYWIVNTIRYQLKQNGINNEWRDIVRVMNTQKMVTTTMTNNRYEQIIIRQCSQPTQKVTDIYTALGYKQVPFAKRKFVVPPAEHQKRQSDENEIGLSG